MIELRVNVNDQFVLDEDQSRLNDIMCKMAKDMAKAQLAQGGRPNAAGLCNTYLYMTNISEHYLS
jgi:hypothetical protein